MAAALRLLAAFATLCGAAQCAQVDRQLMAMGTGLSLSVQAGDRAAALAASESVVRALEAAEDRLGTWRPGGELDRFNHAALDQAFVLSPLLAHELGVASCWWRDTGGAFDPGIGALTAAWGLRCGGRLPADNERLAALACGGLAGLEMAASRAWRRHAGLIIDEGGFGKGAGLDEALHALAASAATAALIDLGGQLALYGEAGPTRIAVADPRDRLRSVAAFVVDAGSVATSGNSERGIEVQGARYGHVLDPHSGWPAPDFGSLTVWAADPLDADCLSTGLFVMGPDQALRWAEGRVGVEVLTVEVQGQSLRVRATPGIAASLELLAPDIDQERKRQP